MNAHIIRKTASGAECWMQTYSGRVFYPLKPRLDDIQLDDIAASLSKMCRFAGHCARFYSVAEHCVVIARLASKELQLTALMHDASEAYLVDIPRPLKPFIGGYREIEDNLMRHIAGRFDFQWPLPDEVKRLDTAILTDEREQNMAPMDVEPMLWGNVLPGLGVKIEFWTPAQAELEFHQAFHRYGGRA